MFVIKFMADIVDPEQQSELDLTADPEARPPQTVTTEAQTLPPYDPHHHRIIKNPTSYSDTMIHFLKGSIGAGLLAMPEAVQKMGIIASVIGLVVIGVFATACIQILIATQYTLCKRWRRGYMSYSKSMRMALKDGPKSLQFSQNFAYYFVDGVLIFWQLGICTIYMVFVAENIKQVCDFHGYVVGIRLHICFLLLPTLIICLVQDLKLMTPISSLSNVLTVLGLLLVFFYLIEDDLVIDQEKLSIKSLTDIPVFVGTCLFSLEAVGVSLALEYNMSEPKRFVGLFGLFNLGMAIAILLYLLVGLFGYMKYGNDIKSSITLNLPEKEKKAQAAKIIFAMAIYLTFPLQNFVAYKIIWNKLSKKVSQNCQRCPDYTLRMMLVLGPWAAAVAVPQLGPIISLIGALSLSLLAMILPGMMEACVHYSEPGGYGFMKFILIRDIFIVLIGFLIMFSGLYSSVIEIISHFS